METRQTYLFVCRANVDRSRTAEDICRKIVQSKGLAIDAVSAGVSEGADNPLTQDLADRADIIFVMEEWMKEVLQTRFKQSPRKVICLDIPDEFRRGDVLLQRMLRDSLIPYLVS